MRARMQADGQLAHGMRARMHADGRHDHARRNKRTKTRQYFAPRNGNGVTHLQVHVVVNSKTFNTRLHVLCCHESCGADLGLQLIHCTLVGAVEEFSVGQQIRPVRGVKLVKSGGARTRT